MSMLWEKVGLPLVCGYKCLAAVLLKTLGRWAPLGPVTGALTVLARLARRKAQRSTTSVR